MFIYGIIMMMIGIFILAFYSFSDNELYVRSGIVLIIAGLAVSMFTLSNGMCIGL